MLIMFDFRESIGLGMLFAVCGGSFCFEFRDRPSMCSRASIMFACFLLRHPQVVEKDTFSAPNHRDTQAADLFVFDNLQRQSSHTIIRAAVAQLEQILPSPVSRPRLPYSMLVRPITVPTTHVLALPVYTLVRCNNLDKAVVPNIPPDFTMKSLFIPGHVADRDHEDLRFELRSTPGPPLVHHLRLVPRPSAWHQGNSEHCSMSMVVTGGKVQCNM